jgi:hypothetical protein
MQFHLLASQPEYSDQPDSRFPIAEEEKSPRGDLIIEERSSGMGWQIWLSDPKQRSHRIMLFAHQRSASFIMSPDEAYVAVSDRPYSNQAEIRLYKRVKGLEYREETKCDINAKAWAAAKRHTGLDLDRLDHRYAWAIRWLDGSSRLRVGLDGHGNKMYLDQWRGVYNLKTGQVRALDYDNAGIFK